MSSSGSQRMISQISRILPISELIDHINLSKGKSHHLNDPQNILRENNTKREIENLTRSRDAVKREVCELDRNLDLAELSNLKLEDDLRKTQRKCDELAKTVALLMEEKNQKDEKIIELENKNAESKGVYLEKCESLEIEIVKMGKEIEGLRRDNVEATKTMEELRLRKSESDQVTEGYKNRYDMISLRIEKLEKSLAADMLNGNSRKGSCYSGGRSCGLSMRAGMKGEGCGLQMCSGMKGEGWGLQMCSGRFSKTAQTSSAAAEIVEISDDDDEELNPDREADVPNVGESKMNIVQSPSPRQRSKRNRMDLDSLNVHSTARKKRNVGARDEDNEMENQVLESGEDRLDCSPSRKCVGEEETEQASDYQTPPENLKDDSVSTDSDDSCTDSRIDNLLTSLGIKK